MVRTLFVASLSLAYLPAGNATNCGPRATNVPESLRHLDLTWAVGRRIAPGWTITQGKGSPRSGYELYTRYAGLSYVLGVTPEDAMKALDAAGKIGPEITPYWRWEDYARMGEAALIVDKPVREAMAFLKDVWSAPRITRGWDNIDFSRTASAAFIANRSLGIERQKVILPGDVALALDTVWRESAYSTWRNGAYSRAVEASLISGVSVQDSSRMLDLVYQLARGISPGWNDDDYARIARAVLVADQSALRSGTRAIRESATRAVEVLAGVYAARKGVEFGDWWHYMDYSRVASAAIITGKSPLEAMQALSDSWKYRDEAPGWHYADYSVVAAAALLGKGSLGRHDCTELYKAW